MARFLMRRMGPRRFLGQEVAPGGYLDTGPTSSNPLRNQYWRRPEDASLPTGPTPPDVRVRGRLSRLAAISTTQGASPEKRTEIQQLPPWLSPPFGAFCVDVPVNRTAQAVAAGGTLTIRFPQIPTGAIGICSRIGVFTDDAVSTRITTRINEAPVPPFGGILGGVGTIEDPTELSSPIVIPPSSEFDLLLTNIGVGIVNCNARLMGWWYSQ